MLRLVKLLLPLLTLRGLITNIIVDPTGLPMNCASLGLHVHMHFEAHYGFRNGPCVTSTQSRYDVGPVSVLGLPLPAGVIAPE